MMIFALIIVMLLSLAIGFLTCYLVYCKILNPNISYPLRYTYKEPNYCEDFGSKFDNLIRDINSLETRISITSNNVNNLDESVHDNFVKIKKLEELFKAFQMAQMDVDSRLSPLESDVMYIKKDRDKLLQLYSELNKRIITLEEDDLK